MTDDYDLIAPDGSILYRVRLRPVAMSGSGVPDRVERALRDEFEELEIERRDVAPTYLDGVGDPL